MRVQKLVEKGWCNESAAFIYLKCNEIFTQGLSKKLKDIALKRQKNNKPNVLKPFIAFHTLVELVDVEDRTNEENRTFDLPLDNNNVTSKLESLI